MITRDSFLQKLILWMNYLIKGQLIQKYIWYVIWKYRKWKDHVQLNHKDKRIHSTPHRHPIDILYDLQKLVYRLKHSKVPFQELLNLFSQKKKCKWTKAHLDKCTFVVFFSNHYILAHINVCTLTWIQMNTCFLKSLSFKVQKDKELPKEKNILKYLIFKKEKHFSWECFLWKQEILITLINFHNFEQYLANL